MERLQRKFTDNIDKITETEEYQMEDADLCVVCFGTEARAVKSAINKARSQGYKVGMLRMLTVWPFPEKLFENLGKRVKKVIVSEGNFGQYYHPVSQYCRDAPVVPFLAYSGKVHTPVEILDKIKARF